MYRKIISLYCIRSVVLNQKHPIFQLKRKFLLEIFPKYCHNNTRKMFDTSVDTLLNSKFNYENVPLVVIIGATGCGKTKLSVELAQKYNGEIISADSMQIYKGLDIATNKATIDERKGIPHYLMDLVDPFTQFTVTDFQKMALDSIDSILKKNKIPIIVGGTNYYIESILWDTLISSSTDDKNPDEFKIFDNNSSQNGNELQYSDQVIEESEINCVEDLLKYPIIYRKLKAVSSETLHKLLTEIDPKAAKMFTVSNRRKVIRALQVYQQYGKKFSDMLEQQRSNGSRHGGPLRFTSSIILWVDCEKSVLDKRLDDRVDEMIKNGLIEELLQFHQDYNDKRLQLNEKIDYTEGIFQAIGFKEFHNYLLLNEEERNSYEGQLKLGHGIILLKQRTKSYVNKQLKWIRRRFLVDSKVRNVPNVYRLDTTEPNQWSIEVFEKSTEIIDSSIQAIESTDQLLKEKIFSEKLNPLRIRTITDQEDSFISGQFFCDQCQVWISGGNAYKKHFDSKRHKYHSKLQQKVLIQ